MKGMWFIVLAAEAVIAYPATTDCLFPIERHLSAVFSPRVIPAPDDKGLAVVWQDSEKIELQRYDRSCNKVSHTVLVNRTEDFWRSPGQSGLSDAVGLSDGRTAVAWTLDGDVWVRVIGSDIYGSASSSAVRANVQDARWHSRADVRLIANPGQDGFVAAWSSWMQDGDGWGVFARPFTANSGTVFPYSQKEVQVNQVWQHFQWQSQLAWCGNSLWALWLNDTDGTCPAGVNCGTGPFIRRLAASPNEPWGTITDKEVSVNHGDPGPLASALTCAGDDSDDALVTWLGYDRRDVYYNRVSPDGSLNEAPSNGTIRVHPRRRLTSRSAAPSSSFYAMAKMALPFLDTEAPISADLTDIDSAGASFLTIGGSSEAVATGQVAMIADEKALIVMTNTEQGSLYVQLLELMEPGRGTKYPRRQLDSGVISARAVWDKAVGMDLALIICWTAAARAETGLSSMGQRSRFICARKKAGWLVDDGVLEMGGQLALIVMISFIGVFCCVRHCNQAGRARPFRRRLVSDERGRQRRNGSQARLRELRTQLSEIPDDAGERSVSMQAMGPSAAVAANSDAGAEVTPAAPGPASFDVDQGSPTSSASGGHQSWTSSRAIVDECSICQNEVVVRVVLRPCGHTACKKCVSRIVEMNPNSTDRAVCPFCRSNIDGVQTVYL